MQLLRSRLSLVAALAVALIPLVGCQGPCQRLATVICNCEQNASDRSSCLTQIQTDARQLKFTEEENAYCEEKLKTCTADCSALRQGDRAACGFLRE